MEQQQNLELIDIYDITYNPWWLSVWFKITVAAFTIFFVSCVCYFLYKKYRKKPVMPYWKQALDEINQLSKNDFNDGQLFYLQLTDVLKNYLQVRYNIHFVDKTDSELLQVLKTNEALPPVVYETLQEMLEGVMYIKFAHGQAVKDRMELAIKKSIALIELTYKIDEAKK